MDQVIQIFIKGKEMCNWNCRYLGCTWMLRLIRMLFLTISYYFGI